MREYAGGDGTIRKARGKWQGMVRYRELDTGEIDENGQPVKGEWKFTTKLFNIKSYPDNNRGKKAAQEACRKWKAGLEQDEPARAAREQAEREADHGMVSASSTVAEYVDYYLREWLPSARAGIGKKIEPSTFAGYYRRAEYIADAHGSVCIGDTAICDLKRGDVVQWRNAMAREYLPATVRDSLVLLKAALDSAVYGEFIDKNPAEGVEAPAQRKSETTYLDAGERTRLLDDLNRALSGKLIGCISNESKADALGVKLALLTGMRQGEVCGLRWRDVDLRRGVLHIRTAIGRTNNGCYEKSTKSGSSRRDLYVDDENGLLSDLKARRDDMQAQAEQAGVKLSNDVFVIGTIDGAYMQPRSLYRSWKRRAERLQLTTVCGTEPTFHDLRHTFGTVMAYGGCPEISLKNIMGHSEISTTHKYYVGVDNEADRIAMQEAMRRAFHGVSSPTADNVIEFQPTGTEG